MLHLKTFLHIPPTRYPVKVIVKWLWHAWYGHRLQASVNAALGIADVALSLAQVWAVKHAIDIASGVAAGDIYIAVGMMAVLIMGNFACNIAAIWVRNILGIRAQNRMQQRMLDRFLRTEWQGRNSMHSGDVINRLEGDVNSVVNFLTETIPNTLSVLALFAGAFLCLFSMDSTLACLLVAVIPAFVAVSRIYVGKMRRFTREVRDSDSSVQSAMQETVQHRMMIKTLEVGGVMVNRLGRTQSTLRRNVVRRTRFSVMSGLLLNMGFALGYLMAFLWAAVRMMNHTLTFGGMTAFLQLVNRIQNPARNLTKLVPAFVGVLTATERLMELEEIPLETQGDPVRLTAPCGLRLDDVTFRYDDGNEDVLSHVSFDFRPGSCTAILGETGVGKTTLVRLLLALMSPTEGNINMYDASGEHPLTPLLRCNFVYVPQGNTLMSGTIRANLLLGNPGASDDDLCKALVQSCADFVFSLPDGLDTHCGEQGGGLSEGQAQRIAIARALLRNRPVMLFDEATSALDGETECRLLQNILKDNSHTVIFITHRPAVLQYCDAQLKL